MRGLLSVACCAAAAISGAPSRADLAARAQALGFGEPSAAIARDALPGARLIAGGSEALGASRLGGRPDLPAGMRWPRCHGRALSFLAQLKPADVDAVAPEAVSARTGLLSVFADLRSDADGVARLESVDGPVGPHTCVLVRALRGPLTRRDAPRGVRRLQSRPVRLRPTLTVPDLDIAQLRYGLPSDESSLDRWSELEDEAARGALGRNPGYAPFHQVLGWPRPVQESPLYGCGRRRSSRPTYRLLLQLDADDRLGFSIGDAGALYLTGRPADLRAGRLGKLCAEFQDS